MNRRVVVPEKCQYFKLVARCLLWSLYTVAMWAILHVCHFVDSWVARYFLMLLANVIFLKSAKFDQTCAWLKLVDIDTKGNDALNMSEMEAINFSHNNSQTSAKVEPVDA